MNDKEKMVIITHRGASSITSENTLRAFKKAVELISINVIQGFLSI